MKLPLPLTPAQSEVVVQHLPRAVSIARGIAKRSPKGVDERDLVQDAAIGLCGAVATYVDGAVPLDGYASSRIRGAVLDGMRRVDWMNRNTRRRHKLIDRARASLGGKLMREPDDAEVADELNITLSKLREWQMDPCACVSIWNRVSGEVDDRGARLIADELASPEPLPHEVRGITGTHGALELASPEPLPHEVRGITGTHGALEAEMSRLRPNYRKVLELYYGDEEFSMGEIGAQMGGITMGRVSQIHKRALEKLRAGLLKRGLRPATEFPAAA